jgi:DNA gyrase subunit A
MLINSDGIIIRMQAKEISKLGRATQGVKMMNVAEDVNIIALAKVAREDELDKEIEKDKKRDIKKDGEQIEL